MRLVSCTNGEITIKAKNQNEMALVERVAATMVQDNEWIVYCSQDDYEYWIQLTSLWSRKQASELRQAYKEAKQAIK